MHLLMKETSLFNKITVYETTQLYGKMGKYRCLQFDDDAIQGAIDLKDMKRIVLEYARAIIHLMLLNDPSFAHVFVIGHGIGTIAGHFPDKQFTVAEIDQNVVELSKRFFEYDLDNVVVGDGRLLLRDEIPHSLDYIILDAFTKKGTPLHLISKEFFCMTQEKLDSHGAVILNLMGKPKNDRWINAIHSTLSEVYVYVKAFSLMPMDEADIRNIIIMGSNKIIDIESRDMTGFFEIELGHGHIILDNG